MKINLLPVLSFLIILSLLLFTTGCKKEEVRPGPGFDKVVIEKGNTYPNRKKVAIFTRGDRFQTFVVKLDNSMAVTAPGLDSLDWNKFERIFYNNGDSPGAGWRYKKSTKKIQFNVYVHKGGKIVHSEASIEVPLQHGKEYRIEYGVNNNNNPFLTVQSSDMAPVGYHREDVQLRPTKTGRYGFDMWGGTIDETGKPSKAPQKIEYYRNSNI